MTQKKNPRSKEGQSEIDSSKNVQKLTYDVEGEVSLMDILITKEIEVIADDDKFLPKKGHEDDAAFDLTAAKRVIIPTNTQRAIYVGIKFNIPKGFRGIIKERSGLSSDFPIFVKGGVIDAGYQGEIKVILANYGRAPYTVEVGDRIAQIKFELNPEIKLTKVTKFKEETSRGEDGFGSTGK